MAENLEKYEAVLADLENERAALDMLIDALKTRIAAKRGGAQVSLFERANGQQQAAVSGSAGTGRSITLYEGSEQILHSVGKPLHAKILVHKLAAMGKVTTVNSLVGSLVQDPKKRFEKVAPATFGLTEWSGKGVKPQ